MEATGTKDIKKIKSTDFLENKNMDHLGKEDGPEKVSE